MNYFEEYSHSIVRRISSFAYDFRVESNGAAVCECVTDTFVRITGYAFEEISTYERWLSFIHYADHSIFTKQRDCLLSGQPNISEFRIITKQGEIRWLRNYAHPVWGKTQGRVIRIYGSVQDITSQKRDEDYINESESGYYTLLKIVNVAV